MASDTELLIERVVSAHRERDPLGALRGHPAWYDLSLENRVRAYEETVRSRALEAALDPQGLSTTARALLARIRSTQDP